MNQTACDKVRVHYDNREIFEVYVKLFNSVANKWGCKFEHDKEAGNLNFIGDRSLLAQIRRDIIETFSVIFKEVQ